MCSHGKLVTACRQQTGRDGHDTDTKYRYCRYLQVWGKYCNHQVLLVFDTEPALFMASVHAWRPRENLKKKPKNVNFVLEVCLMELDQDKIINCVPDRINFAQLSKTIFVMVLCHNKTVLDSLNLLVSVSKFGIDTTKNPWYRIGIVWI